MLSQGISRGVHLKSVKKQQRKLKEEIEKQKKIAAERQRAIEAKERERQRLERLAREARERREREQRMKRREE